MPNATCHHPGPLMPLSQIKFELENKTQCENWHSKMEWKLGFSLKCAMEAHFHASFNFWLIFDWKLKWKLEWKLAENPDCEHPYWPCLVLCLCSWSGIDVTIHYHIFSPKHHCDQSYPFISYTNWNLCCRAWMWAISWVPWGWMVPSLKKAEHN